MAPPTQKKKKKRRGCLCVLLFAAGRMLHRTTPGAARALQTGTASRSVYTRAYRSRICSTSSSASAWGRETVGLKHPSTSSSASPGRRVGALVMRHAPRARQARSSEQSRPHLAPLATRGRSEPCPGRSDPGRARESAGAARGRDPSAPAPRRVCATRGGARQGAAAGLVPQVQASSLRPCGGRRGAARAHPRGERGVALLPEELARADEGRWVLELPAHHVGPLVQAQRQVAVAPDPLRALGRPSAPARAGHPLRHTAALTTRPA